MIRIKRNFEDLAKEHCRKIKEDYNVVENIKRAIVAQSTTSKMKDFLTFVNNDIDDLLSGNPDKWRKFFQKQKILFGTEKYFSEKDPNDSGKKKHIKDFNVLKTIFDYDKFIRTKKTKYDAYDLVKVLNVNTCPYCNQQFTLTLEGKKTFGRIRPTLDHFYTKAKYPYLALSFWNLIPSCYACNSQLRGERSIALHPYQDDFEGKYKFTTDINNLRQLVSRPGPNNRIPIKLASISGSDITQAQSNADVFRIEDRYQHQSDYVSEIYLKALAYSDVCRKTLKDLLDKKGISIDDSDFNRLILGNYLESENFEKRPLAKLTHDIALDLGYKR